MKPSIIERLLSIFSRELSAVKREPLSIALIDNPSEKLQAAAVSKDSRAFLLIKNPSEKISRIAVESNPSYIKFVPNPSEALQLLAVSKDPTQIANIKNPSLKTQLQVVSVSPECIRFIENPSLEAVKLYVGNDYSKLWNLNISTDKQDKLFNQMFRGKDAWNITNDEYISWLSNYTNFKEEDIKEIYNGLKNSALDIEKLSTKEWKDLLTNGKCNIGRKELTLTGGTGTFNVSVSEKNGKKSILFTSTQAQSERLERQDKTISLTKDDVESVISDNKIIDTPFRTEKYEKNLRAIRGLITLSGKSINDKELIYDLDKQGISLDNLTKNEMRALILVGRMNKDNKVFKLQKDTTGYKIKVEDVKLNDSTTKNANKTQTIQEETVSPQRKHLQECIKGTKKKITEAELLGELKNNNLSLEEMNNEQISQLIKSGETTTKDKTIQLKKGPSGYKIKIAEKQHEQISETVKEIPGMPQLQESKEDITDIQLSEKQLKEIEQKGFANIAGGKLISKIQTPAGYTLKVYNVINTLTRQGQAEA